jgi:hypothetical protein
MQAHGADSRRSPQAARRSGPWWTGAASTSRGSTPTNLVRRPECARFCVGAVVRAAGRHRGSWSPGVLDAWALKPSAVDWAVAAAAGVSGETAEPGLRLLGVVPARPCSSTAVPAVSGPRYHPTWRLLAPDNARWSSASSRPAKCVREAEVGVPTIPNWVCPYSEVRGPVAGLRIHPDISVRRSSSRAGRVPRVLSSVPA